MVIDKVNNWILTAFDFYARAQYLQISNFNQGQVTFLNFKEFLQKNVTGLPPAQKDFKGFLSTALAIAVFILTISLEIWIADLRKEYDLPGGLDYLIFIVGFCVSFLSIIITNDIVDNNFEFPFKKFLFLTHALVPNKQERENKITQILISCLTPEAGEIVSIDPNHFRAPNYFTDRSFPLIQEYKTIGIKSFCKKHFNQSGSGFIRFFHERTQNVEPMYLESFLYFSINIPKATQMTSDNLRKIIISQHPLNSIRKKELEIIFQDYTPNQIERIFTNHVGKNKYSDLNLITKPAKIYATFQDLLESELYHAKQLPTEFKNINGIEIEQLKVKVLETYRDYVEASDTFKNCVRNYMTREGFIITFYSQNTPAICVWVNEGKISEYTECSVESRSQKYRPLINKILTDKGILR